MIVTDLSTSHDFVLCSGPSVEYQKALQLTLPVVEPGWIFACMQEKKSDLPPPPAFPRKRPSLTRPFPSVA